MPHGNEYGHQRKETRGSDAWRWLVVISILIWSLGVCGWNSMRLAAMLGYDIALGAPLGELGGGSGTGRGKLLCGGNSLRGTG